MYDHRKQFEERVAQHQKDFDATHRRVERLFLINGCIGMGCMVAAFLIAVSIATALLKTAGVF